MYPFLDSRNNLYISSDKPGGSGGYDIYVAVTDGSYLLKAVSLTEKVNTENDDIAFRIDNIGQRTAFFTVRDNSAANGMKLMKIVPDPAATASADQNLTGLLTGDIIRDESPGERRIAYSLRQPVEYPSLVQAIEQPGADDKEEIKEETEETEVAEVAEVAVTEVKEIAVAAEITDTREAEDSLPLTHLPLAEVKMPPEPKRDMTVTAAEPSAAAGKKTVVQPSAETGVTGRMPSTYQAAGK
jgi:hypothetical protein